MTDCDGARCHIAVPVITQSVEEEGVCLLIHRNRGGALVANRDYYHRVVELRNRTVSTGRRSPENRKERVEQAEREMWNRRRQLRTHGGGLGGRTPRGSET